jgi:N-acetylmuramoyl-L-alanine amidase
MRSIFLLLALLSFACTAAQAKSITHVIVDAGHGGHDRGARFNSMSEADINLKIAIYLVEEINRIPHTKASLTRTKDEFVELRDRVKFSKANSADLFLSIHANALQEKAGDKHAKGAEFYFLNSSEVDPEDLSNSIEHESEASLKEQEEEVDTVNSSEVGLIIDDLVKQKNIQRSSELAKAIDQNWLGVKRKTELSIRQAPFYVLKRSPIPAVLIEVGFIDNPEEAKKLATSSFQKTIAKGISEGLKELLTKQ